MGGQAPAPAQVPAPEPTPVPQQPAAQPPYAPVYAPPPQAAPPQKSNTLKYVLFGCLGLIVLGGLITVGITMFVAKKAHDFGLSSDSKNPALAAVKLIIAANPDTELVSSDDDKGTVTIRQKSTGKTITVNVDDIKNGNISFSDERGESRISAGNNWKPPSWVPVYPGAKMAAGASTASGEEEAGGGGLTTGDSTDQVLNYYESALKKEGLTVSRTAMGEVTTLTAQDEASQKTVNVIVTAEGGETKVQLSYSRKR